MKLRQAIKDRWVWLWIAIGAIAGFFAFGPIGSLLGAIGGLYIGWHVKNQPKRKKTQ